MTRLRNDLKARPTTYRGIDMRSRLEARFASGLDKLGVPWDYEPRAFASEAGQYLPDFQLLVPNNAIYVEVKPVIDDKGIYDWLEAMSIIWASDPQAHLVLASPELGSRVLLGTGRDRMWNIADWCQVYANDGTEFIAPLAVQAMTEVEAKQGGVTWDAQIGVEDGAWQAIAVADGIYGIPFDWSWSPLKSAGA